MPPALESWEREYGGAPGRESGAANPTRRGIRALEAALARTGRNREGAFALLAADALLTSAVRGAAEGKEPEAGFRQVLQEIGRLVPEPGE